MALHRKSQLLNRVCLSFFGASDDKTCMETPQPERRPELDQALDQLFNGSLDGDAEEQIDTQAISPDLSTAILKQALLTAKANNLQLQLDSYAMTTANEIRRGLQSSNLEVLNLLTTSVIVGADMPRVGGGTIRVLAFFSACSATGEHLN